MAVGYPKTRADIDDRSGALAVGVRNLFDQIVAFKAFLDATPDTDLTAAPINYTTGDVAVLKSAFSDLAKLAAIYRGEQALPSAQDFRAFAKQLAGVL